MDDNGARGLGKGAITRVGPAILGVALFILALLLTGMPLLAIVMGLGGYLSGLFLFPTRKEIRVDLRGLSEEDYRAALQRGDAQLAEMKRLVSTITSPAIRSQAEAIVKHFKAILHDLRKEPQDYKAARSFLEYYPSAVLKVLGRYLELQTHADTDPSIRSSLTRTESMLGTIARAFEKQLAQLLQDDVMDLDTELELLRRTMQSEGLSE